MGEIIFVGTRSPEQYNKGCIEGALNLHDVFTYLLPTSTQTDIDLMQNHFSKLLSDSNIYCTENEHVILYEDNLKALYGSSCRGYFLLKYMGHPNVSVIEGGYQCFLSLSDAQKKQIKSKRNPNIKQNDVKYNINDQYMCDYKKVLEVVEGHNGAHLLDVRDEDEWKGLSSSPYGKDFCPRKGRIPKSKWIEWYNFMEKEDGSIKSKVEIQRMMEEQNINKEDEIIVYCFKGARASNTLMILKESGYHNVSNYFASWNEWSRDMNLPIQQEQISKAT